MDVEELLKRHEQLEALLRNVGPAPFIKALRGATRPGELRAHDTQVLEGGWRVTRFVYLDPFGSQAVVGIYTKREDDGRQSLVLKLERLALAA